MASTQDLKRRLRSITNTRKLTRAMELVASARLRRAQLRIEAMRPYADRMVELMAGTAQAAGAVRLPLLQRRDTVKTVAIVPITADRGMAGAFNAQILRRALALMREAQATGQEVRFFSSGKKAQSTLRFRRLPLIQAWTGFSDKPAYGDAQAIAHALAEAYTNEEIDSVQIVYNAFVSPLVQRVTVTEILPVPVEALAKQEEERAERSHPVDFFYEPEPREILARLLPVYVETELYRALLESAASEQGARMTAMRNAS
jgi:F-type H+-transporting ATPase subunit gamma